MSIDIHIHSFFVNEQFNQIMSPPDTLSRRKRLRNKLLPVILTMIIVTAESDVSGCMLS